MKLAAVRKHALALEAVTEEPHHHFSSFRVRGKIFVTVPPDEAFIHVFVGEEDRAPVLAVYPEFAENLVWGRQVVGLRLRLEAARPAVVKALVQRAYDIRVHKDAGPPKRARKAPPPAAAAAPDAAAKVATMQVMVLVKATDASEQGTMPPAWTARMMAAMGRFNDALRAAGVLLAAEGLMPSAHGKRIVFDGARRTVVDGPFAPAGHQVAGFWIWQVKDMDEALAWAKRCPNPMPGLCEIEIRPLYGPANPG